MPTTKTSVSRKVAAKKPLKSTASPKTVATKAAVKRVSSRPAKKLDPEYTPFHHVAVGLLLLLAIMFLAQVIVRYT